jgi:hypothetical protein
MLSKNRAVILGLSLLMASTSLSGCEKWVKDGKINITIPPIARQPAPASPTSPLGGPVTDFPFPQAVPSGTVIAIDGSTSMVQINQALQVALQETFSGTTVEINATNTHLSIQDLLAGRIDIAAIARPLTPSEQQQGLVAIPLDGSTSADAPEPGTLFYAYKQPANPAAQVFLGYVTSPQGRQIIKTAQLSSNELETAHAKPTQSESAVDRPPKSMAKTPQKPLEKRQIRGIYLSRYQITNNADEQTIRERVRYYHAQGINTIVHGVWGNGCTMYRSEVMQQALGYDSCPNQFKDEWLNWLIDEAHQLGMEVHAYFEKGIKIDRNSPIFDLAVSEKWLVPGVDRTYSGIEHYVLDVEIPEVANLFTNILVEFVEKYPNIDAVQWDDYLGYHAELPGQVDRTQKLTNFVKNLIVSMKKANPSVSFDICHHNPYWAKRYFAADWEKWGVDRVFIQAYNEKNYAEELNYAQKYDGIAITDGQLSHLEELVGNSQIGSIMVFPFAGNPEATASSLKNFR